MQIKILEIKKTSGEGMTVCFSTNSGVGEGYWHGIAPEPETAVDVELDINEDLVWSENVKNSDAEVTSIRKTENGIHLVLESISTEEDGCLAACIDGGIILLDVEKLPRVINQHVEIFAERVDLYPTHL